MSNQIIGRENEKKQLDRLFKLNKSILLAVYGRRRVGKTFLINEFFSNKFFFKHTGISKTEFKGKTSDEILKIQLGYFSDSLKEYGADFTGDIDSWREAFNELRKLIKKDTSNERKVIFIDEMPWLDTPSAYFLTAFEHFWNDFGSTRSDLLFIICGSATSWIENKIINSKGGLYNRVNYELKIEPLSLKECEDFCIASDINLRRYQITQLYMILGGIPFYLSYFDNSLTLEQNIDNLFFIRNAKMLNEFDRLFDSTFESPESVKELITILAQSKLGLTKNEICKMSTFSEGGTLSNILDALIVNGFVLKYKSFKTSERSWRYKIIDPFCLFYLRFVKNHEKIDDFFWSKNFTSQSIISWRGNAFEIVCFNHIKQIKNKINILGLSSSESLWYEKGDNITHSGAQIDLLIIRKDNVVNICEAKFYGDNYHLDKEDYNKALNREKALALSLNKRTIIEHVLITTFGLEKNMYSDLYKTVVTLDDLFVY